MAKTQKYSGKSRTPSGRNPGAQGSLPSVRTVKDDKLDLDLHYSLVDQKLNRDVDIPKKIYDLIRRPDTLDYKSFRDVEFYDQLKNEQYGSLKWPDLAFGADKADLIRVCVYGNNGSLISSQYVTNDKINSYVNQEMPGKPAITAIDAGEILRKLGFKRGRFKVKFDFLRLQAGSPFPVLVNENDKIFNGNYEKKPDEYFYASQDDLDSETVEGDKLFPRENKYIIQKISGDRTEVLLSPSFINDEEYLESFRVAAYNCINWFSDEDPTPAASFGNPSSNILSFNTNNNMPMTFMNGTIRINNAYFMGKRIIDEIREEESFEPSTDIFEVTPNLLKGRTMETTFGWRSGGNWPNDGVINFSGDAVEFDDKKALRLENVIDPNPAGQFAIKAIFQNTLNLDSSYLNLPRTEGGGAKSENEPLAISSAIHGNLQFQTTPVFPLPPGIIVEDYTMTFSCYVKGEPGDKLRFMAHADPWGVTSSTDFSSWVILTSEWQRHSFTFTLSDTNLSNKLLIRIIWEPRDNWDPSNLANINTKYFLTAGAQLEPGVTLTPFHREGSNDELFKEQPIDTILKFDDPDGKIIIGELADGDEFKSIMAGGKLIINDAHPILDLSSDFIISEIESEKIYEWDMQAANGAVGDPTQGGEVAVVHQNNQEKRDEGGSPYYYHLPDAALNGQAIRVTTDKDVRRWSNGLSNLAWSQYYVGTADIGYHAHWKAGKGVDGGVAMCFPDLNYQDYIFDQMVQARRDAGDAFGKVVPSEDVLASKNDYAHRHLQIYSYQGDNINNKNYKGIGALSAYGVRAGDKVLVTWMQKSDPIDFEQGGRKGLWVGINHWTATDIAPPEPLVVTDDDIYSEDNAFHLYYGGPDNFAAYIDNHAPVDLEPNWANTDGDQVSSFLDQYGVDNPTASGAGGDYYTYDGEIEQSEAFKWYWVTTTEWDWSFNGDSNYADDYFGYWTMARLDAAVWPDEDEMSPNAFRKFEYTALPGGQLGSKYLAAELYYPSYEDYPTNVNISSDGVFVWNRNIGGTNYGDWTTRYEGGGSINWSTRYEVEGENVTLYRRTYRTEALNSGPSAISHSPCQEYNQWEKATLEFEITDFFALDMPIFIEVRGHYGAFGTVWGDKFDLSIIKSSLDRPEVQENAVLGPLEFTITNIFNENQIEVDKTYTEASEEQGGIVSSYGVNKYSSFDSGFSVGYISQPSGSENIYARYEGKILDVQNDLETQKKLILNKSYEEYGNEINAVMTGPDAVNLSTTTLDDYFVRFRSKDADNLYTYIIPNDDSKSLITNFKPISSETYPGSIAYKLIKPLEVGIEPLDTVFIAEEVTPTLRETIDLNPFIEEKLPETVLRQPNWSDVEIPIRDRATEYKTHTDLIGNEQSVKDQLEDRILSGSLENVNINIDYRQYENFVHFSSAEKRINNFKIKLTNIETYKANSASLSGTGDSAGYLLNTAGSAVSGSASEIRRWENSVRSVINGFDDFENYMYFEHEAYVTSSLGEFFDNSAPKISGDGTLTSPYVLYSVTSSQFTEWYSSAADTARLYDRNNRNRLVNLLPEHISTDRENIEFLHFMDMMGHHYDIIWTHIKALSDVHDRSEDVTKGISQALVEPVANSLGFDMIEGRDLVSLPQYHLGLSESGSKSGIYNIRYTKKSQKDVTREIWNRILSTMPYMLKTKGTKQSLKALLSAYGIPTSILRIQEYGGPRPTGEPDFEIKQKFTKALDFKGGQSIQVPWYHTSKEKAPDTIEMRFKTPYEANQILANKLDGNGKTEAAIYLKTTVGSPISSVTMDVVGSDYLPLETWVTFSGGGGSGATGTPTVNPANGRITGITVTNGGFGYTSAPTITIHQNTSVGSGAIATAVLGPADQAIDGKGQINFFVSGSDSVQSMSITDHGIYNNEYWSLMVRRRTGSMDDSYTEQYFDNDLTATTQSFDMFLGYYDAGMDRIKIKESGSMTVSGSTLSGWYTTGSTTPANRWYLGGNADGSIGTQFSGSMMEFRYWSTPLNANAFWNHVGAPKAVNGNNPSSSYYDLSFRLSMDDYINLYDNPKELKDYTHTDGQVYVTGSGFSDEINFSNVADRQKAFVPKIGFGSQANKIRIESATLKSPDGGKANLSPTERVEISSFDNAGLDSNKLGVFFAPSDVINEDIMLSLADLDFAKYIGDPRDVYEERYTHGNLDGITDTYWKKWTTRQGFWDYIKLIKYYDLSLFDHIRKLAPARAKKNIGLLIESHLLERPKVVMGAPPIFKDIAKNAEIDATYPEPTSLFKYSTASTSVLPIPAESIYDFKTGNISDTVLTGKTTGSRHDYVSIGLCQTGSIKSSRDEFETEKFNSEQGPMTYMPTLKGFGKDPLDEPLSEARDYADSQVYMAGGSDIFFENFQPMITASRKSSFNKETIPFYSSSLSASLGLAYSSSYQYSEYESVYNSHTGLFRLAYEGCKNDGSRSPDGVLQAVEIYETNPYSVKVDKKGDNNNLTVDFSNE